MTTGESAFLEQVCEHPDDDAPRLIYADWLDEQGDPRGQFIRVQLALARAAENDPCRTELLDREAAMLARFHGPWSAPLRGIACSAEFSRGFVNTVNVEGRVFLRRADDLFRLAPIRHVRLLDVGSTLKRLMDSPFVARLSGITISAQHIDEKLVRDLVASPHVENLTFLNISRNRIGDRGAEQLAWSPALRRLRELNLADNAIGDSGARALAESSHLSEVRTLELRRNELSRVGAGDLIASPALHGLRHLGLALNYFGMAREIPVRPRREKQPMSLDLSENGLGPESIRALTELPIGDAFQRFVLERNEIGNEGAAILAAWFGCQRLQSLVLASNRIGDDGARALARSSNLHQLAELDLSDNPIHDRGAFEFLNPRNLPRLKCIHLPHLGLTPQVRRALATRYRA